MLEEMPPFPERDSSILAKLKKKKPSGVPDGTEPKEHKIPQAHMSNSVDTPTPSFSQVNITGHHSHADLFVYISTLRYVFGVDILCFL